MSTAKRIYAYYLNERGNLFHVFDVKGLLRGTRRPSGPTFLTETKFLDFFSRRLEFNHVGHIRRVAAAAASRCSPSPRSPSRAAADESSSPSSVKESSTSCDVDVHSADYLFHSTCTFDDGAVLTPYQMLLHFPYVSPCGPELNFVMVQDGVPVVFHSLDFLAADAPPSSPGAKDGRATSAELCFAGTMKEPFDVDSIAVSPEGKMFHQLTTLRKFRQPPHPSMGGAAAAAVPQGTAQRRDALLHAIRSTDSPEDAQGFLARAPLSDALPLSSVDIAESVPLQEKLFTLSQRQTRPPPATTVSNPGTVEDMRGMLAHVTRPPRGLLGASIGLTLGLDFIDEEKDEKGHYTMVWDGERKVLPFI